MVARWDNDLSKINVGIPANCDTGKTSDEGLHPVTLGVVSGLGAINSHIQHYQWQALIRSSTHYYGTVHTIVTYTGEDLSIPLFDENIYSI